MEVKINSYVLGRTITFSGKPGGYIYADLNANPGGRGNRLRTAGRLKGDAIRCGETEQGFQNQCRNWYRSYVRNHPERLNIDCDNMSEHDQVIDLNTLLEKIQTWQWQHSTEVTNHLVTVDMKTDKPDHRIFEYGAIRVISRSEILNIMYQERFDRNFGGPQEIKRSAIPDVPLFQVTGKLVKKSHADTHSMDPFDLSNDIHQVVGEAFWGFDYSEISRAKS